MSPRVVKWLAWTMALATILCSAGAAVFLYLTHGPQLTFWASNVLSALLYSIVGALILSRLPRHRIGWLFCVSGGSAAVAFAGAWGAYLLAEQSSPVGAWLLWLVRWLWVVPGFCCLVCIVVLFPNGQPPSPRWRWVVWAVTGATVLFGTAFAIFPGRIPVFEIGVPFENPVGLVGADWLLNGLLAVGGVLLAVSMLGAVLGLIWRLQQASGVERQQLKWFAYAGAVAMPLDPLSGLFHIESVGTAVASVLLPIAAGIAILRYRLFDIDILIRRTVTYALVTGVLLTIFFGSIVVLQHLFASITGQSQNELVTVVSTLAIAALFVPLRNRVQRIIDRRFYRHKYDAQAVLENFAATARDETDTGKLTEHLLNVVEQTMHPQSSSVWLAESGANKK